MKYRVFRTSLVVAGLCCAAGAAYAERLQPSDLTYIGAFRVPETDALAGTAAIDNPSSLSFRSNGDPNGASDGFPGSLFINNSGAVTEISIPRPVKSTNASALNAASQLQMKDGIMGSVSMGGNDRFGGVTYMPPKGSQTTAKLYWSTFEYYNVDGTDYSSIGMSDVNLAAPNAVGQWHVGPRAGTDWDSAYHGQKYGEYLIPIDQAWADQYVGGKSLLVGRYREAGAAGGSMGPVLTAIGPWLDGNPPASGANLSAVPLMYFNTISNHQSDTSWMEFRILNDPHYSYYSAGDHWRGGAWVARGNKKAIIMVGRKGTYDGDPACPSLSSGDGCGGRIGTNTPPFCYGGTAECPNGIAVTTSKGYHAGPYRPRMIFIDPDELAQVAQGQRAPSSIDAYNAYDPTNDWPWRDTDNLNDIAGAAYDEVNGYLYVAQANGYRPGGGYTTPWPIIHVYQVSGVSTPLPQAPASFSVR